MTKNLLLLTCAAGALGLTAGASYAATAAATDTSQSSTSVTEIVVTAEKREQSLQKIPVAVSVFTGAQRDTIGINTVADVTNFAPGFSYDPANVHAYIRGVGRQSVNVTDDQRVANYEDEFYVYSPYGLDKSSLFLSQVQIERGPQSVGGRNAAAGSIDMLSVRPTDEPYAELRATVGNFGTHTIEGAVSGQVAPGLDLRLAGFDKNQDQGYYKNLIGPDEGNVIHEWYVEGQLDWKPNDKFELWMRTFYEAWNGRGDAGSRTGFWGGSWDETALTDGNAYVGGGLFVNPNFGYAAPNGNPSANAALNAHNNGVFAALGLPANVVPCGTAVAGVGTVACDPIPTSVTLVRPGILNNPAASSNGQNFASENPRRVQLNNYDDFNYIATYHAANFDIKYNGGFQGYNYYLNDPGDGPAQDSNVASFTLPSLAGVTPLTIFPQIQANYVEDDFWTAHDITFQSTTDSPFQWTAGGFFFYQQYNQPYSVFDTNQPQLTNPIALASGVPCGTGGLGGCAANPNNYLLYLDYNFTVESTAGYGQASYKFNDKWKISGNLRYNFDNKFGTETSRYIGFNNTTLETPLAAAGGLPLYYVLGANSPSIDLTALLTCPTGVPTSCNSGPLAPGVKSKGVFLPNGFVQRQLGITSDAFTGGGEVEFTPTPDIFTYARYGRGYESPSFNAGQNIALPAVKPEYLNAYEIGYKQSFGKNLLIDIAGYYYDYQGLQVPLSIANGGVTQALFINVPKSVSEGVEFEAFWTPIHDLVITASYSYDHTSIQTGCSGTISGAGALVIAPGSLCVLDTNDPGATQPGAHPFPGQLTAAKLQSVKGDPLPDAPANKLAIAAAYTWHFDPGDFVISGDYAFRDTQVGTLFNRFYDSAPSWSDLSFRATWKGPHDRYEITGYVKNALNALQYTVASGGAGLNGSATGVGGVGFNEVNSFDLNPPRTYGVEMRYKFF